MAAKINASAAYFRVFQFPWLFMPNSPLGKRGPKDLKNRPLKTQYIWDVAYWYGTLIRGNRAKEWKTDLLKRMWTIIWFGGLWRKNHSGAWCPWENTDMPIATCLSHGGRVLVELPYDAGLGALIWQWLWAGHDTQTRLAATHGAVEGYLSLPHGPLKHMRETAEAGGGNHFGVNIASGGYGNIDPISGNRIDDKGKFGHLYIYYLAPTDGTYGALMFGAEDSSPMDRSKPVRFIPAAGQTGHVHWFGGSGPYSLTGGEKLKKLSLTSGDVPTGDDSMFVNPSREAWNSFIGGKQSFKPDDLGHSPPPAAYPPPDYHAFELIPPVNVFQKATYVRALHRRDSILQLMDKELEIFHSKDNVRIQKSALDRFIQFGFFYISQKKDSENLQAVVEGFIQRAKSFEQNDLGKLPPKPLPHVEVIPPVKVFQKATYVGPLHWRNNTLQLMDKELEIFHSKTDVRNQKFALERFIKLGNLYIVNQDDSEHLESVVAGFVQGAERFKKKLPQVA